MLVDSEGRSYRSAGSSGTGEGTTNAVVSRFDATELPPDVQSMTFDLSFPYVEADGPEDLVIPGPWHFRLTLPVLSSHVIDSPGAVTVRGVRVDCVAESEECARLRNEIDGTDVPITLLRVLSSPSELRMDLVWNPKDISSPEGARPGSTAVMQLEGAGCAVDLWPPPRPPGAPPPSQALGYTDGTQERRLSYPPGEPGSECTFTVSELVAVPQELQRGDTCCKLELPDPRPVGVPLPAAVRMSYPSRSDGTARRIG
ncbi:MAG: hypothetical protein GEU73_04320 [Chloroflexi bacterium]|nr:hypothetical protein [Chloroflexota bacterium]